MTSPFASHFPALRSGFSYLDNASGAQVPSDTIDTISGFLSGGSCNVGQPYPASRAVTELKARARNAGATGWIVKPFDPQRLVRSIRMVTA